MDESPMKTKVNIREIYNRVCTNGARDVADPEQVGAVLGSRGFTILELLVVVAIIGLLMSIAIPAYTEYKNMAKISRAKSEIRGILSQIAFYQTDKINLPPQLSDLPSGIAVKDPWGNPYVYTIITTANVARQVSF
jgi:prepilin-type N-terminal cleavage/methylation domain-containing protein